MEKKKKIKKSTFHITINPNQRVELFEFNIKESQLKNAIYELFNENNKNNFIKNLKENFEDVIIHSIEKDVSIEVGSKMKRLHSHTILTIFHFGKIHINVPYIINNFCYFLSSNGFEKFKNNEIILPYKVHCHVQYIDDGIYKAKEYIKKDCLDKIETQVENCVDSFESLLEDLEKLIIDNEKNKN